ncbi:sigma-70 family RNA polymerase sigma factor [Rubritalea tangerina]|uniref:Sigma-70 family RNA polymerase sigma factor n=1 Tax=Rubritalea tangerina TaxID=430798 RepID=A0ABW4ZBA9_9BACT
MHDHDSEEESTFVSLLTAHQSVLRGFVISLLPGCPEVEDVIQNTNAVLWKKRREFTLGSNFNAWVLKTARFQVMAQQQRLKREKRAPLDEDVLALIANEASTAAPHQANTQMHDLNTCLEQLSLKDQELVLHRYWKKAGLIDYAKSCGRSVGSLKVALYRVRSTLRNCIEIKQSSRESATL